MAQNSVKRTVVLDGKVGSGFSGMVAQVLSFSDAVEQLGKKSADFLNKGLETYKDYETNMLAAQFALSSQYKNAGELNQVMEELGENAQQWAASTIFHTDDVSNAINEAAHAGWDLNKILTGIPQAMLIAQAGGLDLSQGLDYLIKMMNGTGTAFEDAGQLVDQWAMAANSSATNIGELGEAFLAMGSSARFADSTGELFTMLATLANVGTTGSQAGTALRSAIVRLIAPTTKADAAMSMLGADAEEIASVLADESVTKAAKKLEGLGFSAYKSNGQLKPLTEVFSDLYETTKDLDEASRNEIIAAIFPTRTIATAMALLEGAKNNYDGLYESITNSKGYAESGAEIMMSGLMGSTETLASKWEEFMRKVGEFTAPEVKDFNSALGGIVDTLNSFPDEVWNGFVGGLEGLVAAGGIAGAAKTIASLVGMLGPLGTAAVLGSVVLGTAIGYLNELDRVNWSEKFGQMDLDVEALNTYLDGIHTKWETEKETLDVWNQAINETLKSYETASTELSSMLMTDVLTGKELTQEDRDAVKAYYSELYTAALSGVRLAKEKGLQSVTLNAENADAGTIDFLQQLISGNYDALEAELHSTAEGLGKTLASALEDGMIDVDEQRVVNEYIRKMNAIEAQIAAAARQQGLYKQLYKSQTLGQESAEDFIRDTAATRDASIQAIQDEMAAEYGMLMSMLDTARKNGGQFTLNGQTYDVSSDSDYETLRGVISTYITGKQAGLEADERAKYTPLLSAVFDQMFSGSDMAAGWNFLRDYMDGTANLGNLNLGRLWEEGTFNPEVIRGLNDLFANRGKMKDLISLFGDDETAKTWAKSLDSLEGLLPTMLDFGGENGYRQRYLDSGGIEDDANFYSTPEERASRKAYYDAQRKIEDLYKRRDHEQYMVDLLTNIPLLNGAAGTIEGHTTELGNLQAAIEQAEAEFAKMEVPPVELIPDFSQVENAETPILSGIIRYKPVFMPANGAQYIEGFANGGRADTPSIFGEAGAEWAIPESHDARTAELLNAARAASGFTWSELIARNGGLNGGGGSVTIQNYAPVIHARDAAGVGAALEADKERLKKIVKDAIRESRMMDNARMYA